MLDSIYHIKVLRKCVFDVQSQRFLPDIFDVVILINRCF